MVAALIFGCLADISTWMKEHHLQLNLAKTELLVFPATPALQHDFTIQIDSSKITPSSSVRNLGVIFDDQLTFKDHIAKTARSCRFALHNIRKNRPFLAQHAAQLLVQALVISRLDYCNALLARPPSCTIKPLQMIQNAAAWLVFSKPKRTQVTALFVSLHWLPVAARIKFKNSHRLSTLLLPLTDDNQWATPRGAITERHKITFQNVIIHRSWLVEWTFHPYTECWVPDNFQTTPENSSLPSSLDFFFLLTPPPPPPPPPQKKKNICSLSLTSPCLASFCSEKCLKSSSTSCDCLAVSL